MRRPIRARTRIPTRNTVFIGDKVTKWLPAHLVVGGAYRTPITITEQSGHDLTDYQVKIVLDSSWDGWSNVAQDGSDIYFMDSSGNPLYYYIESWDYANQQAIIWVKVSSIPANGQTVIYMCYGGDNPYNTYHDPHEVFLVFDDFSNDPTDNYIYSQYDFYDNFVGMYQISDIVATLDTGLVLEYDIEPLYYIGGATSDRIYWYFGITKAESGTDIYNEVYPWSALATTTYSVSFNNRYKRFYLISNGDGESSRDVPSSQVNVNTWYHVRHIITSSIQRLIIDGYAELTTNEPIDITQFKYIAIWGWTTPIRKLAEYDNGKLKTSAYRGSTLNYEAYLDNIKLYKYVDPEPSVSIGSSE